MPELPEIMILSRQMAKEIIGKRIAYVEIIQSKCLNVSVDDFCSNTTDRIIDSISSKGKWIIVGVEGHYMLIHLGMGGDLLYFAPKTPLPEKYQFKIEFSDRSGFTIHFWWFGKIHLLSRDDLIQYPEIKKLGISPLDSSFTFQYLENLLSGKKGNIKSFLLDQKNISGIGNVYAQEILFAARLHPMRRIPFLSEKEREKLYYSIIRVLKQAIDLGGLAYEKNFYSQKGAYGLAEMSVGYKKGQPCPICGTVIEKTKTGSTSTHICPKCQIL